MPSTPKVKICGLRSVEDVKVCVDAGADYIGLNFVPSSPRLISVSQADSILNYLHSVIPEFQRPKIVLLFYKNSSYFIEYALKRIPHDFVQYVSDDSLAPGFTSPLYQSPNSRIVSYRVRDSITDDSLSFLDSKLLILDSYTSSAGGGTGETFPWERVSKVKRPYLLAGGLTPENVSNALVQTGAFGVDVASGVESSPGVKDPELIRKFISNAKRTISHNGN